VQLLLVPELTMGFCRASMLSPDGRCRAFDSRANGYVRSEGVGVVVLRPLVDAIASGDLIYAVIKGSAINQDGHTNGMTVPHKRER
jgi:acyl transferase domain-containing protein